MKVIKDPVFISVVLAGIAVGAGVFVAGGEYPRVSTGFLLAWVAVAVAAAYVLAKRHRHD